jgi:hypothetical protein
MKILKQKKKLFSTKFYCWGVLPVAYFNVESPIVSGKMEFVTV